MLKPVPTGPAPPPVGMLRSFLKIDVPFLFAEALDRSLLASITAGLGSRAGAGGGGAGTGVGAWAETEGWARHIGEVPC